MTVTRLRGRGISNANARNNLKAEPQVVHTEFLTTTGTYVYNKPIGVNTLNEVLIVAGGGGGSFGDVGGGSGGAGGVLYLTDRPITGDVTVTVGTGGSNGRPAGKGANSSFDGVVSNGGGPGAGGLTAPVNATAGTYGSGGGGYRGGSGSSGTAGQGNNGGSGGGLEGNGGGGRGSAGNGGVNPQSGGRGMYFWGIPFGSGGAGGKLFDATFGHGAGGTSPGGGGQGSINPHPNTGGGGHGANRVGGNSVGATGIIIVRWSL